MVSLVHFPAEYSLPSYEEHMISRLKPETAFRSMLVVLQPAVPPWKKPYCEDHGQILLFSYTTTKALHYKAVYSSDDM